MIITKLVKGFVVNHLRKPAQIKKVTLKKRGSYYYVIAQAENRPPLSIGKYADKEKATEAMKQLKTIVRKSK